MAMIEAAANRGGLYALGLKANYTPHPVPDLYGPSVEQRFCGLDGRTIICALDDRWRAANAAVRIHAITPICCHGPSPSVARPLKRRMELESVRCPTVHRNFKTGTIRSKTSH